MALNWSKFDNVKAHMRPSKDPSCDCVVRVNGEKMPELVFRFYKNSYKKPCGDLAYIMYTTDDDNTRVYFRGANSGKNSHRLLAYNKSSTARQMKHKVKGACIEYWKRFVGSYNLSFDEEEGFYYIDIKNKSK